MYKQQTLVHRCCYKEVEETEVERREEGSEGGVGKN